MARRRDFDERPVPPHLASVGIQSPAERDEPAQGSFACFQHFQKSTVRRRSTTAAAEQRRVGSCVSSYEAVEDGMDAVLFARPAVPVLPAFHPLECPRGGAAHGALGPLIGRGFDGLADAVDEEPHQDEDDDSDHGPSAVQRRSRRTRYVRCCGPLRRVPANQHVPLGPIWLTDSALGTCLTPMCPYTFENGACAGICHRSQRPSAFPAGRGRALPVTCKRTASLVAFVGLRAASDGLPVGHACLITRALELVHEITAASARASGRNGLTATPGE